MNQAHRMLCLRSHDRQRIRRWKLTQYSVNFRNLSKKRKLKVQNTFKGQQGTAIEQTLTAQMLSDVPPPAAQTQLSKYTCATQTILGSSPVPSERRRYCYPGVLHPTEVLLALHKTFIRFHLPQLRDPSHKQCNRLFA